MEGPSSNPTPEALKAECPCLSPETAVSGSSSSLSSELSVVTLPMVSTDTSPRVLEANRMAELGDSTGSNRRESTPSEGI